MISAEFEGEGVMMRSPSAHNTEHPRCLYCRGDTHPCHGCLHSSGTLGHGKCQTSKFCAQDVDREHGPLGRTLTV